MEKEKINEEEMENISKMTLRKATNKYTSPESILEAQKQIDKYNELLTDSSITKYSYWDTSTKYNKKIVVEGREEALYTSFMVMLSSVPLGLELWMRVSTNYKQLQTIYYQRRHHRLKDDWGAIIKMIETLPYFKEFILGESELEAISSSI